VNDPNLVVGTETHDDAGVYRLTPELAIVQTLDFFPPVVDDPFIYGQIAAANALSDIYAMGAKPITAMNLVCYPDDKLSMDWLGRILQGGGDRCQVANCTIVGGHTVRDAEIKFGLSVTGVVHPEKVITNAGAKPGDLLVLTKPLGTGFVTTAAKRNVCPTELLDQACRSMVQLNKGACTAMLNVGVLAATDVTGFGLAGHGMELANGAKVTLRIRLKDLPLFPSIDRIDVAKHRTRAIDSNKSHTAPSTRVEVPNSNLLDFLYDPQTSGGLLICVEPGNLPELQRQLAEQGTLCQAVIGEVLPRQGETALIVA
jgi:selenide, water dikinase